MCDRKEAESSREDCYGGNGTRRGRELLPTSAPAAAPGGHEDQVGYDDDECLGWYDDGGREATESGRVWDNQRNYVLPVVAQRIYHRQLWFRDLCNDYGMQVWRRDVDQLLTERQRHQSTASVSREAMMTQERRSQLLLKKKAEEVSLLFPMDAVLMAVLFAYFPAEESPPVALAIKLASLLSLPFPLPQPKVQVAASREHQMYCTKVNPRLLALEVKCMDYWHPRYAPDSTGAWQAACCPDPEGHMLDAETVSDPLTCYVAGLVGNVELILLTQEMFDGDPEQEFAVGHRGSVLCGLASACNVDCLRYLLRQQNAQYGFTVNDRTEYDKSTALMGACRSPCCSRLVKQTFDLLLSLGADVGVQDAEEGATALHFAAGNRYCSPGTSLYMCQKLVAQGAATTADKHRRTALHWAVAVENKLVVEFFLSLGRKFVDVNAGGGDGGTALRLAAAHGNVELGQLLLKHGADIHDQGTTGSTPLHTAAKGNHVAFARLLIDHDPAAAMTRDTRHGDTAMHTAARNASLDVLKFFLLERGGDVNEPNVYRETPLCLLLDGGLNDVSNNGGSDNNYDGEEEVQEGNIGEQEEDDENILACLQLLIDQGTALNNSSTTITNPLITLFKASSYRSSGWRELHTIVLRKLLDAGANVNTPCGQEAGQTPLHAAARWIPSRRSHTEEVFPLLMSNGSNEPGNANAIDSKGRTPLCCTFDPDAIQFLLSAGADPTMLAPVSGPPGSQWPSEVSDVFRRGVPLLGLYLSHVHIEAIKALLHSPSSSAATSTGTLLLDWEDPIQGWSLLDLFVMSCRTDFHNLAEKRSITRVLLRCSPQLLSHRDKKGLSALHHAIVHYPQLVEGLLQEGKACGCTGVDELVAPMDPEKEEGKEEEVDTSLPVAKNKKHGPVAVSLESRSRADSEQRQRQPKFCYSSLLHFAAQYIGISSDSEEIANVGSFLIEYYNAPVNLIAYSKEEEPPSSTAAAVAADSTTAAKSGRMQQELVLSRSSRDFPQLSPRNENTREEEKEEAEEAVNQKGVNEDDDAEESSYTPLLVALLHRNYQFAKMLLRKGADLRIPDGRGRYPIHYVCAAHSIQMLNILMERDKQLAYYRRLRKIKHRDPVPSGLTSPLPGALRSPVTQSLFAATRSPVTPPQRRRKPPTPPHLSLDSGRSTVTPPISPTLLPATPPLKPAEDPAADARDIEDVPLLELRDQEGFTPFYAAIATNAATDAPVDEDFLPVLLGRGQQLLVGGDRSFSSSPSVSSDENPLLQQRDKLGMYPVHYATFQRNAKALQTILIAASIGGGDTFGGSGMNAGGDGGDSSLFTHLTTMRSSMVDRVSENSIGVTPLHIAAANDDIECGKVLAKNGANINAKAAGTGCTPLHVAITWRSSAFALWILSQNSVVNTTELETERTPLHDACRSGMTEVAQQIIRQGGKYGPSVVDKRGTSVFLDACSCPQVTPIVESLLLTKQVDVNQAEATTGVTPLYWASLRGNVETVKLLVAAGAELTPSTTSSSKSTPAGISPSTPPSSLLAEERPAGVLRQMPLLMTPLAVAVEQGHIHVAKFLLDSGAPVSDLDFHPRQHTCAIMEAAKQPATRYECLELLLERGANPNVVVRFQGNMTPLMAAVSHCSSCGTGISCTTSTSSTATDEPSGRRIDSGRTPTKGGISSVQLLLDRGAALDAVDAQGRSCLFHAVAKDDNTECLRLLFRYQRTPTGRGAGGGSNVALLLGDEKEWMPLWHAVAFGALQNALEFAALAGIDIGEEIRAGKVYEPPESDEEGRGEPGRGDTLFHFAVASGNTQLVSKLMESYGADINQTNCYGVPPIGRAIVPVHCVAISDETATTTSAGIRIVKLPTSTTEQQLNMVKNLLEATAPQSIPRRQLFAWHDNDGRSALHLLANRIERHQSTIVGGGDPDDTDTTESSSSALLALASLLIEANCDPNEKDSQGLTPVALAAAHGKRTLLRYLISTHGGDVSVQDSQGRSCMHLAAGAGSVPVLQCLCEELRLSPSPRDDGGHTPLHMAVWQNRAEAVRYLVNSARVDVNATSATQQTALHCAVLAGKLSLVEQLLSCGADINAVDEAGRTPLHDASLNTGASNTAGPADSVEERAKICQLLLLKGANVHFVDANGASPLHDLLQKPGAEKVALIDLFVSNGANVNLREDAEDGATPLHYAAANGEPELCRRLLHHGARVDVPREGDAFPPLFLALMPKTDERPTEEEEEQRSGSCTKERELQRNTSTAMKKRVACVRCLIDHGADPARVVEIVCRNSEASSSSQQQQEELEGVAVLKVSSVGLALENNFFEAAVLLLQCMSPNRATLLRVVNMHYFGHKLPVLTALQKGALDLAALLVTDYGADVDLLDPAEGLTAREYAVEHNLRPFLDVLLSSHAADGGTMTHTRDTRFH